jgi:DNA helicase-2/ATP-dependent DNA helicase PcrA
VIAKNLQQFKKNVFSENEEGEKIKVYRSLSDADEANFVAGNIWETINKQRKYRFCHSYTEPTLRPELLKMR